MKRKRHSVRGEKLSKSPLFLHPQTKLFSPYARVLLVIKQRVSALFSKGLSEMFQRELLKLKFSMLNVAHPWLLYDIPNTLNSFRVMRYSCQSRSSVCQQMLFACDVFPNRNRRVPGCFAFRSAHGG